jgi:hypothetical protein
MRREPLLPRPLRAGLIAGGGALFAVLVVLLIVSIGWQYQATAAVRSVEIGGVRYEAMSGRPLEPHDAVDAQLIAGLPAADRHVPRGEVLYGAFLGASNDTATAKPAARDIELRDASNHDFRAVALPASNPYAYRLRNVPGRTRVPPTRSPAAENLAAEGYVVVFRIPRASYDAGPLELVIHDPLHRAATAELPL